MRNRGIFLQMNPEPDRLSDHPASVQSDLTAFEYFD